MAWHGWKKCVIIIAHVCISKAGMVYAEPYTHSTSYIHIKIRLRWIHALDSYGFNIFQAHEKWIFSS